MAQDVEGIVYLLHFSEPFSHAKHYAGWATDVDARLEAHRAGRGANLTKHVVNAGIELQLARTWEGKTRKFERSIKQAGKSRLCPICKAEVA